MKTFDKKTTAYGKEYLETSERTADDKTWGDSANPGGYTSPGAVVDEGSTNYGKLHLSWKVPYEAGTLEVRAYDENGDVVATDSVTTSKTALYHKGRSGQDGSGSRRNEPFLY